MTHKWVFLLWFPLFPIWLITTKCYSTMNLFSEFPCSGLKLNLYCRFFSRGVRCVGYWLLVNRLLFSPGSVPTLHALVWRCRHIFSPPAEPKKRAPPVSAKGHCRAYRTGQQLRWWSTEEEKHWVKEGKGFKDIMQTIHTLITLCIQMYK